MIFSDASSAGSSASESSSSDSASSESSDSEASSVFSGGYDGKIHINPASNATTMEVVTPRLCLGDVEVRIPASVFTFLLEHKEDFIALQPRLIVDGTICEIVVFCSDCAIASDSNGENTATYVEFYLRRLGVGRDEKFTFRRKRRRKRLLFKFPDGTTVGSCHARKFADRLVSSVAKSSDNCLHLTICGLKNTTLAPFQWVNDSRALVHRGQHTTTWVRDHLGKRFWTVTFEAMDDTLEVQLHQSLVRQYLPVIAGMFTDDGTTQTGISIPLPKISVASVNLFLEVFLSGVLPSKESASRPHELLTLANEFGFIKLKLHVESLIATYHVVDAKSALEQLSVAEALSCALLKEFCIEKLLDERVTEQALELDEWQQHVDASPSLRKELFRRLSTKRSGKDDPVSLRGLYEYIDSNMLDLDGSFETLKTRRENHLLEQARKKARLEN